MAGIFLRVQYAMLTVDLDLKPNRVLVASWQAEPGRYTAEAAVVQSDAGTTVRALPGVESVCLAMRHRAQAADWMRIQSKSECRGRREGVAKLSGINIVSGDFFETFHIPIRRGSYLSRNSKALPLHVVSEASLAGSGAAQTLSGK